MIRWVRRYRSFIPRLDSCLPVGQWSRDYFLHYGADPRRVFVVPHSVDSCRLVERAVDALERRQVEDDVERDTVPDRQDDERRQYQLLVEDPVLTRNAEQSDKLIERAGLFRVDSGLPKRPSPAWLGVEWPWLSVVCAGNHRLKKAFGSGGL